MKNFILILLIFLALIVFNTHRTQANELALKGFVKIPATTQTSSYYIGKYPITNVEYKAFLNENPQIRAPRYWQDGNYPREKENHPVVFVSYNDALKYCKWLETKILGYIFRLPTLQEWEMAAAGPSRNIYPWGNSVNSNNFNYNVVVSNYYLKQNPTVTYNNPKSTMYGQSMKLNQLISISENGSVKNWINHRDHSGFVYTDLFKKLMDNGGFTTPVNQYPNGKSYYGVYDMAGNTWDWTSSTITAENGAEKGQSVMAIKGGSWYATANSCKTTMRGEGRRPQAGYNTVGFRVVAIKK